MRGAVVGLLVLVPCLALGGCGESDSEVPPGSTPTPASTPAAPLLHEVVKLSTPGNIFFGATLSLSGDTVVVGAPGTAIDDCAAYVFRRNQGGPDRWGQVATLTSPTCQPTDHFGEALSLSGDVAIVGGPFKAEAYIFRRNQGGPDNWGEVARLRAERGDFFGTSVSVSGDVAVVGQAIDSSEPRGGSYGGAAYVFHRDRDGPDNWGEVAKLAPSWPEPSRSFGRTVSVYGDVAMVRKPGGSEPGSVYVFRRDEGGPDNWGAIAKLHAPDPEVGDEFGASISVSGNRAIIGATRGAGSAYVFYQDLWGWGTDYWNGVVEIAAPDPAANVGFANSVSLSGDVAVVGDPWVDIRGTESGTAYVFHRNQGGADRWGLLAELAPSDPEYGDNFGGAVSVSGDLAVIGSEFHGEGNSSGAAYVFDLSQLPTPQ